MASVEDDQKEEREMEQKFTLVNGGHWSENEVLESMMGKTENVIYDLKYSQVKKIGDREYREIGNEPVQEDFTKLIRRMERSQKRKLEKDHSRWSGWLLNKYSQSLSFYNKIWSELSFIIIDHFQVLGLLWILPLSLPHLFYQVFRFTLYFNFDLISSKKPISNTMHFVPKKFKDCFPWYLIVWWTYIALIILWRIVPRLTIRFRMETERLLHSIVYVLYVPFVMYMMVYGACGSTNSFGQFRCNVYSRKDKYYGLARSIPFLLFAAVGIHMLPIILWRYNRKLIVFRSTKKHEKHIRSIETEFAMNITRDFISKGYYMINSYHRNVIHYMTNIRYLQKLLIVIVLCAVPSQDRNSGKQNNEYNWIMGLSTLIILIVPLLLELVLKPYRVLSPLIASQILGWTNVINAFFGWMKATGVQNPFLVDRYLSIIMLVINWGALGLVLLLILIWLLLFRLQWIINPSVINELNESYSHYIEAIQEGYLLYDHSQNTHPLFVRCDLIQKHMYLLRQFYLEAIKQKNPLELTLEEILMKLEDEHSINEPLTILPHRPLQELLPQLRQDMDIRELKLILIPFHKRVVLMKIMAFCAFRDLLNDVRKRRKKTRVDTNTIEPAQTNIPNPLTC